MTLSEWIRGKILKFLKIEKLNGSPNDDRLTFISDDEGIRLEKIRAHKIWYLGDGDELLNYYTNQQIFGWLDNPIFNRNKRNYFWGISSAETNIKRIHTGLYKALIDSTTNIIGKPTITCDDPRLEQIFKINNFAFRLVQELRVKTLVTGDICVKLNINNKLANVPLYEIYDAEEWEPVYKSTLLIGVIFKSYYKDKKGKNYVLNEIRRLENTDLYIEYYLYKLGPKNQLIEADFDDIPELKSLKNNRLIIRGVNKLFAVPFKYYYNTLYKNRGKPIADGKLDLFDMMDEAWSQASQTVRVSTPVEYYDVSILSRDKNGIPILPSKYNRQYVATTGAEDGDGVTKNQGIITTQPELNFDKYGLICSDILSNILSGWLSPSSLGIDVAKKDNADAQREKEKQTIFTRDTIIEQETDALIELANQSLMVQDYLDSGNINIVEHQVTVSYDEFANPSFESELQILGPAWSQGQISTEQYVKMLWAGKLSEEELMKEKEYLENNKAQDNIDMEKLLNNGEGTQPDLSNEESGEEIPTTVKE